MKDKACEYLLEGLHNNTTLTQLQLDNNHITCEGVAYLAKLLTKNQTITHLYLEHN